jgi:hypothetical protein
MCGRLRRSMLAAMQANCVSISLRVALQDDTPAGRVSDGCGSEREFFGWLELIGTIDALLHEARREEDR